MPKNYCIMQIWAESGKSTLPICNYSQILYQFLTFTQNLKRSRWVREACLELCEPSPSFVELTVPTTENMPMKGSHTHSSVAATLHTESGITIDLYHDASPEFLRNLIGAASHAEWCFRISQNISCHRIHGAVQRHGRTGEHHSFPFSFRSLWQKYPVPVLWQENRPKGKTADGLKYSLNQEKYLKVFLDHPNVPIDNSTSERSIRTFCLGKKNWMFHNTANGAHSSALVYSISETAKLNNLRPYYYFKYILTELPKHAHVLTFTKRETQIGIIVIWRALYESF